MRGPEPTRPLYSQRAEHSPERESKSKQILWEELLVGNIWGGVYVNVLVKGQDMMCLEGRVSVLVRFVDLIQTQTYLGRSQSRDSLHQIGPWACLPSVPLISN